MTTMTKQEIAIALSEISWGNIQSDDPYENNKLDMLQDQLMNLEKRDIIEVMTKVLEATRLADEDPIVWANMLEFRYID